MSNGNVTALVRQLESDGYVSSQPAPEDRRRYMVALTPQGRAHFQELAAAHHGWIAAMFDRVPDAQMAELYDLLAILKQSLGSEKEDSE